jgi:alpha-tubulin suppressor-like RCC1 family protein
MTGITTSWPAHYLSPRPPARRRRGAPVRPGRRWTVALVAVAGLSLAGLPLMSAGASASVQGPPAAQPGLWYADHWGFFFGDKTNPQEDRTLRPVSVRLPGQVTEIGTSNSTQYALLTNGTLWAWGQGGQGQLGDGSDTDSFETAVQVRFPTGVRIAYIPTDAMPFDTGFAVDTAGNVWGWGDNHNGSLCLGNAHIHSTPVELPLRDVTALAGADGHAVYDANGTVVSCGNNTDGVLGDGSMRNSYAPVAVRGLAGRQVVELVSSWSNAGALLSNGQYFDWGYDNQGELGNGTTGASSDVPVAVNLPDRSGVSQVAQGGSAATNGQTLVMLSDGSMFAWGTDTYSQLGDGRTGVRPSPEEIFAPLGVQYAVLASGGDTSYAISTQGDVYAWGGSAAGQVGDGSTQTATNPVKVDSGMALISSTAGNVAVAPG